MTTHTIPAGFVCDHKAHAFAVALQQAERLATPAAREAARYAAVDAYRAAKRS